MKLRDLLSHKGSSVEVVSPSATIAEVCGRLTARRIGALVVTEGAGPPIGIVSERDVVRQLHARGPDVLSGPISEIMTKAVATCTKSDTVDSISALMTNSRVRHVPVLEGKTLIGIVSIGDVVKTRMEELEAEQQQLQSYITQG